MEEISHDLFFFNDSSFLHRRFVYLPYLIHPDCSLILLRHFCVVIAQKIVKSAGKIAPARFFVTQLSAVQFRIRRVGFWRFCIISSSVAEFMRYVKCVYG